MKTLFRTLIVSAAFFTFAPSVSLAGTIDSAAVNRDYSTLVYKTYKDAYDSALALQKSVNVFVKEPTQANMDAAKAAWLTTREPYGESEAFRFYEGPIDFADDAKGLEGPEARLNSWPLNESYIDYVQGNPDAGIVHDSSIAISKETLSGKNQADDEADVATGYHAIEFLLWGQDLNTDGPGNRPVSDYAAGNPVNVRRGEYLIAVTDLLVDDLKFLVDQWTPGQDNFSKNFSNSGEDSISKILTSLATLSGFELASERMATALDSGDQEDEHSCFSDNTHNDFIYNAAGIQNVYTGHYKDFQGASLRDLVMQKDPALAEKIDARLKETQDLIGALPHPIDREILSSPADSPARMQMEKAIASLQAQADLFKEVGKVLGVEVQIVQ